MALNHACLPIPAPALELSYYNRLASFVKQNKKLPMNTGGPMRIVLDAMGSDDCPKPEILAALEARTALSDDEVILVGNEELIRPMAKDLVGTDKDLSIVHAADMITMNDKGISLALKAKKATSKTSMAVGIDLVKAGQADAFVTAGNTGGAMATAFFRLGVLPGVERPALTGIFPTRTGRAVVLDIGANPECKPEHLLQFAIMGSLYAQIVLGVQKPRVGLLSNGEEEGKGNQLIKETTPLLKNSTLNYIGSVEGKELFGGEADVVVTDGFTGNVLLKSSEAVAALLLEMVKEKIQNGPLTAKIGGLMVKPSLRSVKKLLDPAEVGAAPLLGINGMVFIGHGRSDQTAILSALKLARQSVQSNLMASIQQAITANMNA